MTIDAHTAGAQAGRALALRAAAPKAAVPGGARPTAKPKKAAPVPGGAASVTDPLNTNALLTPQELLKRAQQLAQADTAAQVKAIQAVQDQERARAANQAKQILAATQAAAGLQTGIGDQTAASFQHAAQDIGGLAQGFSGQLRDTASTEAQKVLDQLRSVGATNLSPNVAVQGDALANLSYGLGGYLPASALLTGGTALAAAQRQLPASTIAHGNQEALGAVAAGDQAARAYDPKILDAKAALPGATKDYASTLSSLLNNSFNQRLDIAKYLTGIDQFNTKTGLQVDQFNTRTKIQEARLNLDAQKFARQQLQQDRTYSIDLKSLGIRSAAAQRAALAQEFKLSNGGFTPLQVNKLKGDAAAIAADAFNGVPKSGKQSALPPLNFGQALAEMRKGAGDGAIPLSVALDALEKAGFKVPARYAKLRGGLAQQGDPFVSGQVRVSESANRAGAPLNPSVTSFVAQVAGVAGVPLTITTGTNHNEYVIHTNRVSDHWDGNAADILYGHGSPGHPDPALTKLGQDALIAAGMPPAEARKQTGGLFNIGNKQIIFNSMEGGNHYNHLHVGVRP